MYVLDRCFAFVKSMTARKNGAATEGKAPDENCEAEPCKYEQGCPYGDKIDQMHQVQLRGRDPIKAITHEIKKDEAVLSTADDQAKLRRLKQWQLAQQTGRDPNELEMDKSGVWPIIK